MKKIILGVMFFTSMSIALAQEILTVSGTVNGEEGKPLYGVTVKVKGTLKAVITDLDGKYKIEASGEDVLEFTFIGLEKQSIKIEGRDIININMREDTESLDDVVMTGFQTISKERATGSFSSIGENIIENRPVTNIANALEGMATGLLTTGGNLLIRGQGTFDGGTNPLIVLDGFPIEGGFESINPNDIKSITVLKDAAATSIWGARAANGVIVITSKEAPKDGRFKVRFNSFIRISDKINLDKWNPIANSRTTLDYEKYYYDVLYHSQNKDFNFWQSPAFSRGTEIYYKLDKFEISQEDANRQLEDLRNTNYQDDIYKYLLRNAIHQQYDISILGSTGKNNYAISAIYDKSISGFQYSNYDKMILNIRNIYNVSNKLKFNINISMNYSSSNNSGAGISSIRGLSPYQKLVDENGYYKAIPTGMYQTIRDTLPKTAGFPYANWNYNLLEEVRNREFLSNRLGIRLQTGIVYNIMKGLTFDTKFQYEVSNNYNSSYSSEKTFAARNFTNTYVDLIKKGGGWGFLPDGSFGQLPDPIINETVQNFNVPKGGIFNESFSNTDQYNLRGQLNFGKDFGIHRIDALLGSEIISAQTYSVTLDPKYGYNSTNIIGTTVDFKNETQTWDNRLQQIRPSARNSLNTRRFFSLFSNIGYTYNKKYSITGNLRADASNLITDDFLKKFSPMWSLGVGWNINKESFVKDNINFIDRLKLRMTYGISGRSNTNASSFALFSRRQTANDVTNLNPNLMTVSAYPNSSVTWEKSRTFNLGIDYSIFNHKLYGSIDYYNKDGIDILGNVEINPAFGVSNLTLNQSNILNKGIEIVIGNRIKITKNIILNSDLNFSYNINKITKLNFNDIGTSSYLNGSNYTEGKSLNSLYSYKWRGFDNNGYPLVSGVGDSIVDVTKTFERSEELYKYLEFSGVTVPTLWGGWTPRIEVY